MLEAGRLLVRLHPVQAQRVGEPALHDPVPAHDRLRHHPPGLGEDDLLARVDAHHAVADHPPQGDGDRWPADAQPVRQPGAADALPFRRHVIDGLQVA